MRVAYGGQEVLTFNDYIDLGTGKTLHAEPGGVYDIIPAAGRLVDEVPAQWFTPPNGSPSPGRRQSRMPSPNPARRLSLAPEG